MTHDAITTARGQGYADGSDYMLMTCRVKIRKHLDAPTDPITILHRIRAEVELWERDLRDLGCL